MIAAVSALRFGGHFVVDFGDALRTPVSLAAQPVVSHRASTLFSMRIFHDVHPNHTLWAGTSNTGNNKSNCL